MSRDYIPSNNNDFFNFQDFLNVEVTTNATAWNIPAAEQTALDNWSIGYAGVYKNITNVETRTRQDVLAHDEYKLDYIAFLRPFCQGYLVNNPLIPISERVAMGLNPRGLNPPSQRPKITTAPVSGLKALGGGLVRFAFKVEDSNKRSARQEDSNGVEVFFKLVSQASKPEPIVVLEDSLTAETEKAADSGLPTDDYKNMFSTRARFVKQLEIADIGKTMHVYARWVNTSDATKNGPFSMVSTMVVS
ncbi:hypothetical protein OAE48_03650 [Flavobacteriales bacterium]|nr:hypothetical protein [Flavobacteriales bacterium]